jgi:transcriptional regulator GlxA family with amidase domain
MSAQKHTISMLAIDGALCSSMTAPLDAFRLANALYARTHPGRDVPFALELISARQQQTVLAAGGLCLHGVKPAQDAQPDVLLVPGLEYRSHAELIERIQQDSAAIGLIQTLHQQGKMIATSCSGTFALAASGILDDQDATTSWWLAASFRAQFPKVRLDSSKLLVDTGQVITAGAVTAMFSVVLKLVEHYCGPELAQNTARILLIDPTRQSQAPFVSEALVQHPRSAFSEMLEPYLAAHLHHELSIEALSKHLNLSARTLQRKFHQVYGASPQSYVQTLRVDRAKALLETTRLSFDEICEKCGYTDSASFRKLFKRSVGLTPADYQKRFRLRGP